MNLCRMSFALLFLLVSCPSYSKVAHVNGRNLDYLRQLSVQMVADLQLDGTLEGKSEEEINKTLDAAKRPLMKKLERLLSSQEFWRSYYSQRDGASRALLAYMQRSDRVKGGKEETESVAATRDQVLSARIGQAIRADLELGYIQSTKGESTEPERIAALYLDLVKALELLRKNGESVQEYLEMSWLSRLFTDVKGMDEAKLTQVGEDLKATIEKLRD